MDLFAENPRAEYEAQMYIDPEHDLVMDVHQIQKQGSYMPPVFSPYSSNQDLAREEDSAVEELRSVVHQSWKGIQDQAEHQSRSDHHRLNLDQAEQGQDEEQTFKEEDESGAQKRSKQQLQLRPEADKRFYEQNQRRPQVQKRSPAPGNGNGLTLSIHANIDALRSKLLRELKRRQQGGGGGGVSGIDTLRNTLGNIG